LNLHGSAFRDAGDLVTGIANGMTCVCVSLGDARVAEPKSRYARSQIQQADSVSGPLETTEMPGNLIYYALVLIVIALVAALLGFGGVAGTAMSGAHLLLWVAVVIVIVGVVFALIRRA
jgi:uncharacterized membrane protein YtjA (UPF0391 family)